MTRRLLAADDEPGRILVIEDNPHTGAALVNLLELFGHSVELVADGQMALETARQAPPDLVLLDVRLPGLDGYAVCAALKRDPATWGIPVILITVDGHRESQLRGIEAEADAYLQKPVDGDELEARVRVLLRGKRRSDRLERAEDVIFALARAVEAKDAYTEGHLYRMAEYAVLIGKRLGIQGDALAALRYGAMLHDVGKVSIDATIIQKDGPLTAEETTLMRMHPQAGERIVQPLRLATMVAPIVRNHHEQWNGGGYPDRLAGEAIPVGARIVAVADAFDAMTTQRPYNRVLSYAEAAERLRAGAATYWDPQVVAVFLEWLAEAHGVEPPLLSREVGGS